MNKKIMFGLTFLALLAVSVLAVSINVNETEECKNVVVQEEEDILGNCTYEREVWRCDDEPKNTSCSYRTEYFTYPCVTGTKIVEHTKQECATKSLDIDNRFKINIPDYGCSYEELSANVS